MKAVYKAEAHRGPESLGKSKFEGGDFEGIVSIYNNKAFGDQIFTTVVEVGQATGIYADLKPGDTQAFRLKELDPLLDQ